MTTTDRPALADDPTEQLAWLRRMRREQPVWRGPNGAYQVFRHDDVRAILADPAVFSSNLGKVMPFLDPERVASTLTWVDPPAHRSLRQLVGQAFSARAIAGLRPRIAECAADLAAALPEGESDFVDRFAYPLPLTVIAELLGVSPADRQFFRDSAERSLGMRVGKDQSQAELAAMVAAATKDLDEYLLAHIRQRRARPQDDLLSTLIAAEVDGRRLTDVELACFGTLLLNAGYVTTTLLLGNFLLCLRDDPAAESTLRADRAAIPRAIEEVLRHRPPLPGVYRITNQDAEIAGTVLPAGSFVTLSVLSANHDEQQFADPDRFDIDREPGKHIAFGHGIHFCLGAPLARLEAEIATGVLFDEFAELRVSGEPEFEDTEFYGPRRLPVTARR